MSKMLSQMCQIGLEKKKKKIKKLKCPLMLLFKKKVGCVVSVFRNLYIRPTFIYFFVISIICGISTSADEC